LQINQDDATVAVNGRSYLLGGTTLTEQGSSRLVHRTEWVGNALLITTEHFTDDGRSWSDMETYSFDHRAGTLNVYQMHVMATREPVMASHIVHYVREPE
jgi:hypothetical protein